MLRIDVSGWKLSSENCLERIRFPDGEPEHEFLSKFAAHIRLAHHLTNMRQRDMSLQSRAEFLLEGSAKDVSLALRTHGHSNAGWFVRLPEEPSAHELFLQESLTRHATEQVNKQFVQLEGVGRGILLPARTHERPTRIELNVCSHMVPSNYLSTLFVQRLSRALVLAITELGANHDRLCDVVKVVPNELVEPLPEEPAQNAKRRRR